MPVLPPRSVHLLTARAFSQSVLLPGALRRLPFSGRGRRWRAAAPRLLYIRMHVRGLV